jgi:hypothetical protein
MKKKEMKKKEGCPWCYNTPQIFKCMGYVLKSYAGLQIEEQYRGYRYMNKCINHLAVADQKFKLAEKERYFACSNIYKENRQLFEYFQGNIVKFLPEDALK